MKNCLYCAEPIASDAIICKHCGQAQLAANRLNLVISLPLASVAILVAVAYWLLSEVIWLPLTQLGFYFIIDRTSLQDYVPYWTGEIQRLGFFNASWLLLGAVLYLPLVTIALVRFGVRRTAVAALFAPMPFAVTDIWTWWVRSIKVPVGVDPSVLRPRPGILQFLAVLFISGIFITVLHFLVMGIDSVLSKRKIRFSLAATRPIRSITPVAQKPEPASPSPDQAAPPAPPSPLGAASGHVPEPDSHLEAVEAVISPPPLPPAAILDSSSTEVSREAATETAPPAVNLKSEVKAPRMPPVRADAPSLTEPEPDAETVISAGTFERLVSTPPPPAIEPATTEQSAAARVSEPAASTLRSEPKRRAPPRQQQEAPEGGIPAWMIVTGMAILIMIGFVLIMLAFRL